MKKILFTAVLTLIGIHTVTAQVGIGTENPKTSLQVVGKPASTTTADGVQVPSLSLAELNAKIAAYGTDQNGAIVYIDNVSTATSTAETASINAVGFYYYDAVGDTWKVLSNTSSLADGSITSAKILDGTILNADISASAAIAQSKIDGLSTSLAAKANLASPTFTGTVSGIDKTMVGLGNVDNTTDLNKPISTLTQSALDLKAPLASPTFTGTVSGIDETMIGLGSVDNTTDLNKPISTLTQSALDLKADLASPTFTGTPTLPTGTIGVTQKAGSSSTAVATTEFVATAVAGVDAAGLVSITENGNTGYRRADADADNYGDIGVGAVDLSFSEFTGPIFGATGFQSTAMGLNNVASGQSSFVIGTGNSALGNNSISVGNNTMASGYLSTAMGEGSLASGNFSTVMGIKTVASDFGSVVIGQYNNSGSTATSNTSFSDNAPAFVIGNGSSIAKSDAFKVLFNGNTTAAGTVTAPAFVGDGSQLTGITTASIADGSITSAKILDGTILNADISASAAIAQSKIDGLSTSLAAKANLASPTFTGTVSGIDKTMVGLGSVDNTTDLNKPISTLTQSALDLKAPLASPTFTGTVSGIDKTMIGLGSVDNTTDLNKPISTLTQSALDLKAPLASPTFTGTVSGIDKTMIGLGSVDNTTDLNKPISTLTQSALDLKAPLDSPTFTGTPTLPTGTIGVTQKAGSSSTAVATTEFVATALAGVDAAGLVSVTENGNIGYRRADGDSDLYYGNIGDGAVDLSFSENTNNILGATGQYAFATGYNTYASGNNSTAMGYGANALGFLSTAIGFSAKASGNNSTAMGSNTIASGGSSFAIGNRTIASGIYSTAMGYETTASGRASLATGYNTTASDYGSMVIGHFNNAGSAVSSGGSATSFDTDNTAFVIGNGTSTSAKSDAFVVDFSGNVTASGEVTAPAFVGDGSQLTGITTTSIADASITSAKILDGEIVNADISTTAEIDQSKIDGLSNSLADKANLDSPTFTGTPTLPTGTIGVTQKAGSSSTAVATTEFVATALAGVDAAGLVSVTEGSNTGYRRADADAANYGDIGVGAVDLSFSKSTGTANGASGLNSIAMGVRTTASGYASSAMGNQTTASGYFSTAMGDRTTASDFGSVVIGQYNSSGSTATSNTSFSASAPAFVIGNGTGSSDLNDAFVVGFSGNTIIGGDIFAGRDILATGVVAATEFVGDGSQLTDITTTSIADASITSAKILDGTLVNADISSSAAIAQSKIDGLSASLADKADLDSPTFTGTPTLPTGTIGVTQKAGASSTAVATTEFVATAVAGVDAAGLESITENGNTGYRRADADADNYGDIGDKALDLSYSTGTSSKMGATGDYSTVMGLRTIASGLVSTAIGINTISSGSFSTAMGYYTIASDFGSVVMGKFNSRGSEATNTNESASAPAFVIGNGTGISEADRSDAFVVDFSGNTNAAGTVTAPAFVGDGSQLTDITTASIADGSVTSAKILDGTLVNADISSSAAIAQSKIDGLSTSLAAKANLASPTFTGTITSDDIFAYGDINANGFIFAPAFVGDGSQLTDITTASIADASITSAKILDGTILNADISASAAIAQSKIDGLSTSLAAKANLASPTFTGTVSGIDKTMIGLGSVDNTTDLNKPISTLTQSAFDLKAPLASPTFTGTPTLPTGTIGVTQTAGSSSTAVATTEFVATALAGVDAAGLVSVTEGGNTGYRRADADDAYYDNIGKGAVDLSFWDYTDSEIEQGATGELSVAMGEYTKASGDYSTAMGTNTTASGSASAAMGKRTTALGDYSTAMGFYTNASGRFSTAIGNYTTASGLASTAIGNNTIASDWASVVIGQYNSSGSTPTSETSFSASAPAFVIGNGTGSTAKNDAFVVDFSGNTIAGGDITTAGDVFATGVVDASAFVGDGSQLTGISAGGAFSTTSNVTSNSAGALATDDFVFGSMQLNNDNTTTDDDARFFFDKSKGAFRAGAVDSDQWDDAAVGNYSVGLGYNSEGIGAYSVGMGFNSASTGTGAVALGAYAIASGDGAVAMGSALNGETTGPKASGIGSIAFGLATSATGEGAFAFGESSTASGATSVSGGYLSKATRNNSIAIGQEVTANSINEIVLGRFNTIGPSRGSWVETDPLFTIGNGSSTTSTRNAFQILKNGNATLDGTLTADAFVGDGSGLTGVTATTVVDDESITSAKITNGTLVNADISTSAEIDQSKINGLANSFTGKQNTIADGDLTIARTNGLQTALDEKASLTATEVEFAGTVKVPAMQWSGGTPADGQILISDASGNLLLEDLQTATATRSGIITTDNQAFAGQKTFNDNIVAKRYVLTKSDITAASTSTTINLSNGNVFSVNLSTNTSLATSGADVGTYIIKFVQDKTGGRTVTFPSGWLWSGGTVPTITPEAGKTDIVTLIYDGTTYYAAISQNF